jgi:HK97 family phage prohead protease
MKFILSDESINMKGFRVLTQGIDYTEFLNNPVMLYNHNSDNVIGRWLDIAIEGDKLVGVAEFDEDDTEALKIKKKIEKNYIGGTSIGFRILEKKTIDGVLTVTKCELSEVSITALPANKSAVKLFYKDEQVDTENIELSLKEIDKKEYNIMENKSLFEKLNVETDEQLNVKIDEMVKETETLNSLLNDTKEELSKKDTEIETLSQTIKDKDEKIASYEAEKEVDKLNALINKGIEDGKITDKQKDMFEGLSYGQTEKILNNLKSVKTEKLSDKIDTIGSERDNWTLSDWDIKDPEGLKELMSNDPEKFELLYKKDKGTKNIY